MVINLRYPATMGERTIMSLTMKDRVKVRDFLRTDGMNASSVEADVALLSSLTGEPEGLLNDIDSEDWADIRVELAKIWQTFFGIKKKENEATVTLEMAKV